MTTGRWAADNAAFADDVYWGDESGTLNAGEAYWGDDDFEPSASGNPTTPVLLIDWDDDGLFTGNNEWTGRVLDGFEVERGREFVIRSDGSGFEPVMVGRFKVKFKNADGRYDPYDEGGDLYGLLSKNQLVKFIVQNETTGTQYDVFTGYVDDIKPEYAGQDTATLRASEGKKKLSGTTVRSSVYTSKQYDDALSDVLTAAGWTAGSDIDTTLSDTMGYWWMSGRNAWTELQDLSDATLGALYISVSGELTYKSRVTNDIAVATLTEADIFYDYGIKVPSPREVVRNRVRVYARARNAESDKDVWQAIDKPPILAGESITIWANFSYNGQEVAATSVTTPVASTDYTANTQADGGGADKTSEVGVVVTAFATSAKIVFTNNDAGAIYMTLMKLRANIITADEYTFSEEEDTDSIATYGEREFSVKTDWLQDINSAVEHADLLIDRLSVPRQYPRVMLRNKPALQFMELFDLVALEFSSRNIASSQRIGKIKHTGGSTGIFDTELYFEPNLFINTSDTWTFTTTFPTIFA